MKKLSTQVPLIREAEEKAMSDLQKDWRDYFGAKLAKFGVESPADLDEEKKKEFFNDLKSDWEKGKGATAAGKKDMEDQGVKEGEEVNEGRSIETVSKDITKIAAEMMDLAKVWKTAEGEAKTEVLDSLKAKTAKKKDLEKELNDLISGKDKDIELIVMEAEVKTEEVNEAEKIEVGIFVRYKKDKDFTGGKIKSIKGSNAEIHNWDGSTTELPLKDLEYVKSWNESVVTEGVVSIKGGRIIAHKVLNKLVDMDLIPVRKKTEDLLEVIAKVITDAKMESVEVNEADIKSEAEFKEYAEKVLKKAHKDDYDEAKAEETIDGILKKSKGDMGAAVGMLTSGLS